MKGFRLPRIHFKLFKEELNRTETDKLSKHLQKSLKSDIKVRILGAKLPNPSPTLPSQNMQGNSTLAENFSTFSPPSHFC